FCLAATSGLTPGAETTMPLPAPLESLSKCKDFWTSYFWLGPHTEYPGLDCCAAEFAIADGYALILRFPEQLLFYTLGFRHPGSPTIIPLGCWSDEGGASVHTVFRWEETESICRSISRVDVSLPHPGIPLLLLSRFTPFFGSDRDRVEPALRQAWQSLGL